MKQINVILLLILILVIGINAYINVKNQEGFISQWYRPHVRNIRNIYSKTHEHITKISRKIKTTLIGYL